MRGTSSTLAVPLCRRWLSCHDTAWHKFCQGQCLRKGTRAQSRRRDGLRGSVATPRVSETQLTRCMCLVSVCAGRTPWATIGTPTSRPKCVQRPLGSAGADSKCGYCSTHAFTWRTPAPICGQPSRPPRLPGRGDARTDKHGETSHCDAGVSTSTSASIGTRTNGEG